MNIKEFASELGVSTTTVSRALSGHGRVSARTRDMVRRRVGELGYAPNLQAQRLVTGRNYAIALDWSGYAAQSILQDFFFAQLLEGFQIALQRRGYGLLLCGPHSPEFISRWVAGRSVDGVLFIGDDDADDDAVAAIAAQGVPTVLLGHHPLKGLPHVGSVALELEGGIREIAQAFAQHGHQRVAYVGTRMPDPALGTFRDELALRGIPLPEDRIIIAGQEAEDGARAMRQLRRLPEPPTAIFARTDLLAIGVLRAARRLGIAVPAELSVVGHDDTRIAELSDPPLTTVRIDYARLGERAAETLIGLIEEPTKPAPAFFMNTHLVVRETLSFPPLTSLPSVRSERNKTS